MTPTLRRLMVLVTASFTVAGCTGTLIEVDLGTSTQDAGSDVAGDAGGTADVAPIVDGTAPDSAAPDSASPDSAASDSAALDGEASDSVASDSSEPDALDPDALDPDSLGPDSLDPDGVTSDAGSDGGGEGDTAASDASAVDALEISDALDGDASSGDDTGGGDAGGTDTDAAAQDAGATADGGNADAGETDGEADGGAVVIVGVQLCGQVTRTSDGAPIAGATVTLYGDTLGTILASVTTDADGKFCFPVLPAKTAASYYVTASAAGFDPRTEGPLKLTIGAKTQIGIGLDQTGHTVCFQETFETKSWTASPAVDGVRWQVRDHAKVLVNSAAGACVSVPDDETCVPDPKDLDGPCVLCATAAQLACIPKPGALPRAWQGARYAWFGNPALGNYLGSVHKCVAGNGGKTAVAIAGTFTSGPIAVKKSAVDLRVAMQHWFEVESQSPGALHDRMEVLASADGKTFVSVGTLTPITLEAGSPAKGQTTTGFFTAPRWVRVTLALPAAIQAAIKVTGQLTLQLRFDTADKEINGFRGWAVDQVQVLGDGC